MTTPPDASPRATLRRATLRRATLGAAYGIVARLLVDAGVRPRRRHIRT